MNLNFTPTEIVTMAVAIITLISVILGKLVEKRTPDIDEEEKREAQFNTDLWTQYKDIKMERDEGRREIKALNDLVRQGDATLEQTQRQLDLLLAEKTKWEADRLAWEKEREALENVIHELKLDVLWLTSEVRKLRPAVESVADVPPPAIPPPTNGSPADSA